MKYLVRLNMASKKKYYYLDLGGVGWGGGDLLLQLWDEENQ